MDRIAMSDDRWEANSIRLTLFPTSPLDLSGDYWRSIFGDDPEGEDTRPREGLKRQFGPWEGALAEVQITPVRVDISVGPPPAEPIAAQPTMPTITIGPMLCWFEAFSAATSPWLADVPFDVSRIAVAGSAMCEAATPLATYQILQRYIRSVNVKPGVMRDMFFRVNWPRLSDYVEHYNDLQTWASINFAVQALTMGQSPVFQLRQQHFAQLQFDANTPAERVQPLAREAIIPIYRDLIALARQGVTHGEQPSDV